MDLLKRAKARAVELRAQGLSERADRLENAVKMSRERLQPISSRSERISLEDDGSFSFEIRLVFHEGGHPDRRRRLKQ